jgi:23S rRNA (cytidine1920-2'-O)/16S rRNA (cytidine1409-2'-O)-methyltransferase
MSFVSRAGEKLEHALATFGISVEGRICADLGCNVGGFTDCLLRRGAARVYAVDTGYGVLDYKLRKDPRVVVMERTNAMHVELPEKVGLVVIDVAWTRQRMIVPSAMRLLAGGDAGGEIVSLIKPHYEAPRAWLKAGVLLPERIDEVIDAAKAEFEAIGLQIRGITRSPIRGTGGNTEALAWLAVDATKAPR